MGEGGVVRPDQVSLGVLVSAVPRDAVDEAVAVCGVREKRLDAKLPAHVVTYLTLALCLFPADDYIEVATKVTGSLDRWGCWDAGWTVPTASAITQAGKRLGREVFPGVVRTQLRPGRRRGRCDRAGGGVGHRPGGVPAPVAAAGHRRVRGRRARQRRQRGRVRLRRLGGQPFGVPKARVVALAECGTHAFVAAEVDAYRVGEKTLARRLYPRLRADELLTADRGFYSWAGWDTAAATGAALLWRAPTQLELPVVRVLPDGTYLTALITPSIRGRRRERLLAPARAGGDLSDINAVPDAFDQRGLPVIHLARVIEYEVHDRVGSGTGELIVLLTTILDPDGDHGARADELAAAYHQRWQEETANDQLKTHLRGPGRVLRSRLPDLVVQEVWAYLIVHHAISELTARA